MFILAVIAILAGGAYDTCALDIGDHGLNWDRSELDNGTTRLAGSCPKKD